MWRLVGSVDGKEEVLATGKSLGQIDKELGRLYEEEFDRLDEFDDVYAYSPQGYLYQECPVQGGLTRVKELFHEEE